MWFEQLTGFREINYDYVKNNLIIDGTAFISKVNKRRFTFGKLEIPTLEFLRKEVIPREVFKDKIKVSEIIANVQKLHNLEQNENALFQAASQFNLLEMIGPAVTPEQGIDRYERDLTQGPACAIACGAGTIYRNYFVELGDQVGQTESRQIDCLDLIGQELQNEKLNLWTMKNGYALINIDGLHQINKQLGLLSEEKREKLKGKLKIGIQWNTEATLSLNKHKVSQIYCSALPVSYCLSDNTYWEHFARLILEATYEATLYAALSKYDKTGSDKVFLTLVGGGAFGNNENWILESLKKSIVKFKNTPLNIKVVSYGKSNTNLNIMLNGLNI